MVRGMVRGMGSMDHVSSPTFKISNVYSAKKLSLYHFDFYRLQEAGLMAHELHDALHDPAGVVVVEWGDIVQDVLPEKRVTIRITKTVDGGRELVCTYPKEAGYIFA